MKNLLKYVTALLATYLFAWTTSYVFVFLSRGDHLDFSFFFRYLVLAWSFSGGELPMFIWFYSMAGFLPLAFLVVLFMRRFGTHAYQSDAANAG